MTWIKQGCVFSLGKAPNRTTHTQVPTPVLIDDYVRVYYACRRNGMSYPAFFNLGKDLKTILRSEERPCMERGDPGMFDSDGIMPSSVVRHGDEMWMYYIGWNEKSKTARYHNAIGIATSKNGGETFTRMFDGPIIDRIPNEPGLAVMPCVMYENWWRMWYQSGTSWNLVDGRYEPVYVIKYADSMDGIKWNRHPEVCVKQSNPLEAFSNPTVVKDGDIWKMWYCYRGSKSYRDGVGSYRIGYAESIDGKMFLRQDEKAGIKFGEPGDFDSKMLCYPKVIDVDGERVMFYNGNDFGQSGIGVAAWE